MIRADHLIVAAPRSRFTSFSSGSTPCLTRISPKTETAVGVPHLRSAIGPHARDFLPGYRTVQQTDVASSGPNRCRRLLVGLRTGFKIDFVPDNGSARCVRR